MYTISVNTQKLDVSTILGSDTLFSYVREGKHIDKKFVRSIGEGLLNYVPDFRNNKYFKERIDAEEKRMADLHLKHPYLFIIYYRALWAYRKAKR